MGFAAAFSSAMMEPSRGRSALSSSERDVECEAMVDILRRTRTLEAEQIRDDFPILRRTMHGKPLVYLDSAATSQKPKRVTDALVAYYQYSNANVHRGVY